MTTTITVHVGGNYKALITGMRADGSMIEEVIVGGHTDNAKNSKSLNLGSHPVEGMIRYKEEPLQPEEIAIRDSTTNKPTDKVVGQDKPSIP